MSSAFRCEWAALLAGLLAGLAPAVGAMAGPAAKHDLPPILFVSRNPRVSVGLIQAAARRGEVPPPPQVSSTGERRGRLLVREPDGAVRPFLSEPRFFDVGRPAVSYDGRTVVFPAKEKAGDAWCLYRTTVTGDSVARLTSGGRVPGAWSPLDTFDDTDPCWLPDGRIVFASTRWLERAESDRRLVTNLFVMNADGGGLHRITSERNGGEKPAVDPSTGRVIYSRWLFNRYLPSDVDSGGITTEPERAVPADRVNQWEAISILPDGEAMRLAAGNPRVRSEMALYAVACRPDGGVIGEMAADPSRARPGAALALFAPPIGPARIVSRGGGQAATPAVLPDGRFVYAWKLLGGDDDFDLYVDDARSDKPTPVLITAMPGTDETEPAVLAPRPLPPVPAAELNDPPPDRAPSSADDYATTDRTFRFDCLNVFATGGVDAPFPDAPPAGRDLRIRFYGVVSRPGEPGSDSLVLVREAPLTGEGAVHEADLPADMPMFEQIVDPAGRVLRGPGGTAQVPGFNFARAGSGAKCVGCHAGHSALPVPVNYSAAHWFNAAPSARVEAAGSAPTAAGLRGLVDRRTKGPLEQVGWIGDRQEGGWVRLSWAFPIEVQSVTVYPPAPDLDTRTDLAIRESELVFFRGGREVERRPLRDRLNPGGTRVGIDSLSVDAVEFHPLRMTGGVRSRPVVALAEIEVIARLDY